MAELLLVDVDRFCCFLRPDYACQPPLLLWLGRTSRTGLSGAAAVAPKRFPVEQGQAESWLLWSVVSPHENLTAVRNKPVTTLGVHSSLHIL